MPVALCSVYGMDSTEALDGTDPAAANPPGTPRFPPSAPGQTRLQAKSRLCRQKRNSICLKRGRRTSMQKDRKAFLLRAAKPKRCTFWLHRRNTRISVTNTMRQICSIGSSRSIVSKTPMPFRRSIGTSEYKVTDALMAHSQVRANWSYYQIHTSNVYDHARLTGWTGLRDGKNGEKTWTIMEVRI